MTINRAAWQAGFPHVVVHAAEKVRKTGAPYKFAPMSSRERRIVHLALRDESDLRTESEGEGMRRCLVVYPKDYRSAGTARRGIR